MKFLRRLFIFLAAVLLLLTGTIWFAVHYYEDEIKQVVVSSMNEQLRTEIEVSKINLSLWNNFPHASIVFKDVIIHAVDAKNDTLLEAKKVDASFNLIELYRKQYRLIELGIYDGSCKMVVDHSGRENYVFWGNAPSQTDGFNVDLKTVTIKNVKFDYHHYAKDISIGFLVDEAKLRGELSQSEFKLQLNSTLKSTTISNGEMTFIDNRTLFIYSKGKVNTKDETIYFEDSNLGVDGMNFKLDGLLDYSEKSRLQLDLASENAALDKAVKLLPKKIQSKLIDFDIKGATKVVGSINGPISAIDQPSYQFSFVVNKGNLNHRKNSLSFTNTSLKGKIDNGAENKLSSSTITLNHFITNFNGGKIEGSAKVIDFETPYYQFNGKLAFALQDAVNLFEWDDLQTVKGNISADVKLKGRLQNLNTYTLNDWKQSKVSGNIKLEDVGFYYRNGPQHFHKISGKLQLNNNNVLVHQLRVFIDHNQMNLSGTFNNLIGYLLEENDPLFIDAKISSPFIKLEDFLASGSSSDNDYKLEISPRLTVYVDAKIDSLQFKKFAAGDLNGSFLVKEQQLDARGLSFNSMQGKVKGELFIRENEKDQLITFAKAFVKDVEINQLFSDFDNFGQKTISAGNLSGKVTADIDYSCLWSKTLKANLPSLKVESDLNIDKGRLIAFKPLESLSKYIELEELKDISFKSLHNQILIKDEVVVIPRFQVRSSAMSVEIEGRHTFDNHIDYQFQLLLNELLGKKVKKPIESEFGYIEDDGLGRTKLFLKMTGTTDNPEIKYDREQLKNHVKQEIEEEKNTVKQILNKEFGMFKKDSIARQRLKKSTSKRPFTVEWEELDNSTNSLETEEKETMMDKEKKSEKKSKLGKFIDKIAQPNEEEYVEPIDN